MKDLLDSWERKLCCLIPREGAEVPSCHEFSLCDCTVQKLISALRVQEEALKFYAGETKGAVWSKEGDSLITFNALDWDGDYADEPDQIAREAIANAERILTNG